MNTVDLAKGLVAVAAAAMILSPLAVDAKPRSLRVSPDGTTVDSTQTTSGTITDTTTASPDSTTSTAIVSDGTAVSITSDYLSTLAPTYTPPELGFAGRKWRVNTGSTWATDMGHSVRLSGSQARVRFEVRNTQWDRSSNDPDVTKRRAEISGSILGAATRLSNGQSLWGAFSTRHGAWADPAGMSKLTGGVYGQIHMGAFGGSPAVAFRRRQDGSFRITTRGEFNTAGTTRYQAPLSFGAVHDIVYNLVLHPTAGSLRVWVDGVKVVDVANVSIGSSQGGSYWAFGAYFAGGVTSPVIAEYGNHVYPSTTSQSVRITSRPAWPQ